MAGFRQPMNCRVFLDGETSHRANDDRVQGDDLLSDDHGKFKYWSRVS